MEENTSKKELFERMVNVANELAALDMDMKELCDQAKEEGFDAALMKKLAIAKAAGKVESIEEKAKETLAEIEELI